jgi:hypothetical protein
VSLYQLTAEMQEILAALEAAEANPEVGAALEDHLSSIAESFDAKADDYAALIRVCESRAAGRREQGDPAIHAAGRHGAAICRPRDFGDGIAEVGLPIRGTQGHQRIAHRHRA